MDRHLIAPGPGVRQNYEKPRWYVRKDLNDRIEGQRELLGLKNKTVILSNTQNCTQNENHLIDKSNVRRVLRIVC